MYEKHDRIRTAKLSPRLMMCRPIDSAYAIVEIFINQSINQSRALGQPVRQASALTHERGHASPQIVNSEHLDDGAIRL